MLVLVDTRANGAEDEANDGPHAANDRAQSYEQMQERLRPRLEPHQHRREIISEKDALRKKDH